MVNLVVTAESWSHTGVVTEVIKHLELVLVIPVVRSLGISSPAVRCGCLATFLILISLIGEDKATEHACTACEALAEGNNGVCLFCEELNFVGEGSDNQKRYTSKDSHYFYFFVTINYNSGDNNDV